jgi:hypothetical protein
MNFTTIKADLVARGFDYLTSDQQGNYVNRAYQAISDARAWPFLETSQSGTAPMTITDLRQVLTVTDTTTDTNLLYRDIRTLRESDPDLDDTGSPIRFYLDGLTTLKVWPANTSDTINVRYLKRPAVLTGTDTPVIPEAYHLLIVDRAVVYAHRHANNWEAAEGAKAAFDVELLEMSNTLMGRNYASSEIILDRAPAFDS